MFNTDVDHGCAIRCRWILSFLILVVPCHITASDQQVADHDKQINSRIDRIVDFNNGLGAFRTPKGWLIIDSAGNVVATCSPQIKSLWAFNEGVARCRVGDRIGYIDANADIVIKPIYHNGGAFQSGRAHVAILKGGEIAWGYIDHQGRMVIDAKFEAARPFVGGVAAVRMNGVWGYIDVRGDWIIPPKYDHAEDFSSGRALVTRGKEQYYIDVQGNRAITVPNALELSPFSDDLALVLYMNPLSAEHDPGQARFGFIDTNGTWVIPPTFDWAAPFADGVACIEDDAKHGFVNKSGTVWHVQGSPDLAFWEGLIVSKDTKLGKHGYLDYSGRFVIPPTYDEARHFSAGRAFVRIAGRWSLINHKGEAVWTDRNAG